MATQTLSRPPLVTGDSVDPDFSKPFIEVEEDRLDPVPHRYVHGGFMGTGLRFSFYFPPQEQYQGRFFHNTYPMALTSDIGPFPIEFEVAMGDLGFTVDSGAYYVQTNNGGLFRAPGADPTIPGYRANAAAAKFSRDVAARIYGPHRPYGYLFGGSGGSYQTMGAAENTRGVWDGFVPFVSGCNHSIPSMFTIRMHGLRVLRQRPGVLAGIADAVEAGGSGDPYAGLNEEEAAALREVLLMGFPPRGFYDHEAMDSGYFGNISGMIPAIDPTYMDDFWTKPGYLGSDPANSIHAERFAVETVIEAVSADKPTRVRTAQMPAQDVDDAHLVILSGAAAGSTLPIWYAEDGEIVLIATAAPQACAALAPGDKVRIDNAWTLALQTYHRHQVPAEPGYYGWDQFRDASGNPIYPQRAVQIGPVGTLNSTGALLGGDHDAKMLMLSVLLDIDSFPWQADWYRNCVKAVKGADYGDNYALWFFDNAHHENPMRAIQRGHAVSYGGALQQALRDVARWAEEGVRPSDTAYRVEDTQVLVPAGAAERKGVQPTIALTANCGVRAEVAAGEAVQFAATIEVPAGMGRIVSAEWDFEDSGDFPVKAEIGAPAERITLSASHSYSKPGTHFAVLRVAAHREGRTDTPYALVRNIARVRVVVS